MKTIVYCRHCQKYYPTAVEDLQRIKSFEPEQLQLSSNGYNYNGGCYLKTLNRLKRLNTQHKEFPMTETTLQWLDTNGYATDDLDRQGNYGNTALMKASREGNLQIVRELLEAGADIACKNVDGNQALWLACFSENPDVVSLLLDAGIDVDNTNVNGVTPLMYTASSGKEAMVAMLLGAGANPSIKNHDDFTALELAATPGILRQLRKLRS